MNLIERQKGSRRLSLPVEFPLTDSQGALVFQCRRISPDRRKAKLGLEDLRVILAKMANASMIVHDKKLQPIVQAVLANFSKPDLENLLERNLRLGIKIVLNLSKLVSRRLVKTNENLETVQAELNRLKMKEFD